MRKDIFNNNNKSFELLRAKINDGHNAISYKNLLRPKSVP